MKIIEYKWCAFWIVHLRDFVSVILIFIPIQYTLHSNSQYGSVFSFVILIFAKYSEMPEKIRHRRG